MNRIKSSHWEFLFVLKSNALFICPSVIFALPYGFLYSRKLMLDLEWITYRRKLYSSA